MSQFLKEMQAEIDEVKRLASKDADDIASQVLQEARRLCSRRSVRNSEETLGVKTGRLRQSLRKRMIQMPDGSVEVEVYFDPGVAPHAKWVIQGTRQIKPHPILEEAAMNVDSEDWEIL